MAGTILGEGGVCQQFVTIRNIEWRTVSGTHVRKSVQGISDLSPMGKTLAGSQEDRESFPDGRQLCEHKNVLTLNSRKLNS